MKRVPGPYRSGIWEPDPRYAFDRESLSVADYRAIDRLAAVDVAKKQAPPVPVNGLLAIAEAIRQMPRAKDATPGRVCRYLEATICHHGVGIPTAICMLAVMTDGDYAPVDCKFVAGMRAKKVLSKADEVDLNGKPIVAFAEVYVAKVLPAWAASRKRRSPEEADNYWGSAAG